MMKKYDILKIRYSEVDSDKFTVILLDGENVFISDELTSLDSARIYHVLTNIETSLRYETVYTTEQLSATAPLLTIKESNLAIFINRLEFTHRHEINFDVDRHFLSFKSFDDIDHLKNYFAEAQY